VDNFDADNVTNMQPLYTYTYSSWFATVHPTHRTRCLRYFWLFSGRFSSLFQFYAFTFMHFKSIILVLCGMQGGILFCWP